MSDLTKRIEQLEEHVVKPGELLPVDMIVSVLQAIRKLQPNPQVGEITEHVRGQGRYVVSRELVEEMLERYREARETLKAHDG